MSALQAEEVKEMYRLLDSPLLNRRGRFRISRDLIRTDAHNLTALFSRIVVLEAALRWEYDCNEYLALCDLFEELPEGVVAPLYELQFSKVNGITQLDRMHRLP